MPSVAYQALIEQCAGILRGRGFGEDEATWIATKAVEAEGMGLPTHGLAQIIVICRLIEKGSREGGAEVKVATQQGGVVRLECGKAVGQAAMRLAMQIAVEGVKEHGVMMIGASRTSWIGAAGPYVLDLAQAGLASQLAVQNSNCKDTAPYGGIEARFSTNPIGLGIPGDPPVFADFSTAAMSMGKTNRLIEAGKRAPYPVLLDTEGNPTDDPEAVRKGGALQVMGCQTDGHKGYALTLWCEAMAGMAGGDCNNPDVPGSQSFMLTVFDPAAFGTAEWFAPEWRRMAEHVKSARPAPGFDAVRLPGERSFAALEKSKADGVEVDDRRVGQLNELDDAVGVAPIG